MENASYAMTEEGEHHMTRHNALLSCFGLGLVLYIFVSISALPAALAASAPAESLDSLHEKAKKEGKVTIYAALSSRSMEVILPAFMKRFPGGTVDHIDATADQLLARIVSEVRGGRLFGDVFGGALPYMAQASDQKLLSLIHISEPTRLLSISYAV